MEDDKRIEYRFDSGFNIGKWVFGILASLITFAIAGNFTTDFMQSKEIDTNCANIKVLDTKFKYHVINSKDVEIINASNLDDRFSGINKELASQRKIIMRMDKNQLLIMRALKIEPVK